MTKEEVIKLLNGKVVDWILNYPYEPDCDEEVSVSISQDFGLDNDMYAEVVALVYGSFWHDSGDYFTPPDSGGTISWNVKSIKIYDEDGEIIFEDTDITKMNGEYKF